MAVLREFKVFVRSNSTKTTDYLVKKYKKIANEFQLRSSNLDEEGNFVFNWYIQILDFRTNQSLFIFSDFIVDYYKMSEDFYITEEGTKITGVRYFTPTSNVTDENNGVEEVWV